MMDEIWILDEVHERPFLATQVHVDQKRL